MRKIKIRDEQKGIIFIALIIITVIALAFIFKFHSLFYLFGTYRLDKK